MKYILTYTLVFLTLAAIAQGTLEPYHRFITTIAQSSPTSTPRYMGLAGSGVAMGGDPGAAAFNPAGLGQCHASQVLFGLGLGADLSQTAFLGQQTNDGSVSAFLPHLNAVFASERDPKAGVTNITFGISINRVNQLSRSYTLEGANNELYQDPNGNEFGSGFIDYAIARASGFTPDYFASFAGEEIFPYEMAYATGLIQPTNDDPSAYTSLVPITPFTQKEQIRETGAQYDIQFSLAANLKDRLYLGGGLGIQHVYLNQLKTYTERHPTDNGVLRSLEMEQNYQLTGIGINLQLGAIYRLHDYLRLGLSYKTRTAHRISETYQSALDVQYTNRSAGLEGIPLRSNYTITTPGQLTAGIAAFLGKKGFITADAIYINYRGSSFSNPDFDIDPSQVNESVTSIYRSTLSFRLGAEVKREAWRFRAGYAYLPVPEVDFDLGKGFHASYTLGAGVYQETFNVNFGLSYSDGSREYEPFSVPGARPLQASSSFQRVLIQVGIGIYFDSSSSL